MRHTIVKSILGIVWIIVGIVGFTTGKIETGIFCSVIGAIFLFDAFKLWKRYMKSGKKAD